MYAFPSHIALAVGVLFAASASADPAPAYLVKDIATGPASGDVYSIRSDPSPVTFGNAAYFFRDTPTFGVEPWKTDGTPEGTSMLRDFLPGVGDSRGALYAVGGALLLTDSDGPHGSELWKSDGTAAGTTLVKDIWPGPEGSGPRNIVALGGTYYFFAEDPDHALELWRSDGTESGTVLVKDIRPGPTYSERESLTVSGSTLFFFADDGVHGKELWKSDGTEAGTVMVADIGPGSAGLNGCCRSAYLRAYGGGVLFGADDGVHGYELWKSDGTAAGTVLVKEFQPGPAGGVVAFMRDGELAGKVWFLADDGSFDPQIWSSDGTTAGTTNLVHFDQYYEGAGIGPITAVGSTGYFIVDLADIGMSLWKTDGTASGTLLVQDLYAPPDYECHDASSTTVFSAAGLAFFVKSCDAALWRSDGTSAGTFSVYDGVSRVIFASGDWLYFTNAAGDLWRTDGTVAGTARVTAFESRTQSSSPGGGVEMGGKLFFLADDGTGRELWKSDGTAAGTGRLTDLASPGVPNLEQLTVLGNTLFFTADVPGIGRELWKSDGTPAGTVLVEDIYPGPTSGISSLGSGGTPFVVLNGRLYFAASTPATGMELRTIAAGETATTLVKDIGPGTAGSFPRSLTNFGGTLFFAANSGQIWKSDGTAAGTQVVAEVRPGPSTALIANLTVNAGLLFFTANDGTHGVELWKSDGTASGTALVKDIVPGSGTASPSELTSAGGTLYFRATTSALGTELWKSDGTDAGTTVVKDIAPGMLSSQPTSLRAVGARLAFQAQDDVYFSGGYVSGVHGLELWTTDGTQAGTQPIDIFPGRPSSLQPFFGGPQPAPFAKVDGLLVFSANEGVHGEEVWVTDGTPGGTRLMSDVVPGGSEPSDFVAAGDLVFFTANRLDVGRELFAFPRAALADSDGDGLDDFAESQHGTNPLIADTDGDGLSDGAEVHTYGTDPLDVDTDHDGNSDGVEVNVLGTNPLDPNDPPRIPALGAVAATALAALLLLVGTINRNSRRRTTR